MATQNMTSNANGYVVTLQQGQSVTIQTKDKFCTQNIVVNVEGGNPNIYGEEIYSGSGNLTSSKFFVGNFYFTEKALTISVSTYTKSGYGYTPSTTNYTISAKSIFNFNMASGTGGTSSSGNYGWKGYYLTSSSYSSWGKSSTSTYGASATFSTTGKVYKIITP